MFPLSKRNMNSNIDLTMICNKNHHIKMYDQKVKIVLFTVKIVKNFCTRLAWAFPAKNSIIRAYFDSRALQSSHSYWIPQRQRVREYYRSSRRKNESYNFYPKWVITKKVLGYSPVAGSPWFDGPHTFSVWTSITCASRFYPELRKTGASRVIFASSVYILFALANSYKFCKVLNGKFVAKVTDAAKN